MVVEDRAEGVGGLAIQGSYYNLFGNFTSGGGA